MKKETKRKSIIALGALALILAVGATAGTTFAKYSSSKEVTTSTATVAKWGFVINANTNDLFGKFYETDENPSDTTFAKVVTGKTGDDAGVVVAASANSNVVAPGTSGQFTITVSGSAEVDAEITTTIAEGFKTISLKKARTTSEEEPDDSVNYYPIEWTVSDPTTTDGFYTATRDIELVKEHIKSWKFRYDAGATANVSGYSKTLTVKWAWAFHVNDLYDTYDTILGTKAHINANPDTDGKDNPAVSGDQKNLVAGYTAELDIEIPAITVSVVQVNTKSN